MTYPSNSPHTSSVTSFDAVLKSALDIFHAAPDTPPASHGQHELLLGDSDDMRWFLLPSEAQRCLQGTLHQSPDHKMPFTVKKYHSCDTSNSVEPSKVLADDNEVGTISAIVSSVIQLPSFHKPPRRVLKQCITAIEEYKMIQNGDRVLVCLSGGKDSLSLLHTLHQYQYNAAAKGISFQLAAVTVDPQSASYDPSPLIPYLAALKIPYFFEQQGQNRSNVDFKICCLFIKPF